MFLPAVLVQIVQKPRLNAGSGDPPARLAATLVEAQPLRTPTAALWLLALLYQLFLRLVLVFAENTGMDAALDRRPGHHVGL